MTFQLSIKSPADIDRERSEAHSKRVSAECRRRILDVADETTQANVTAAIVTYTASLARGGTEAEAENASGLANGDFTVAGLFRPWVAAMQDACRSMIGDPVADYLADASWPPAPEGLAELAERF